MRLVLKPSFRKLMKYINPIGDLDHHFTIFLISLFGIQLLPDQKKRGVVSVLLFSLGALPPGEAKVRIPNLVFMIVLQVPYK